MAELVRLLGDYVHALGGASIEHIGGAPAHASQRSLAPFERKVESARQVSPVVVHRLAEVAVALAGRFGGYVEASGEVGAVIDRAAESFSGKSVRPPGP